MVREVKLRSRPAPLEEAAVVALELVAPDLLLPAAPAEASVDGACVALGDCSGRGRYLIIKGWALGEVREGAAVLTPPEMPLG